MNRLWLLILVVPVLVVCLVSGAAWAQNLRCDIPDASDAFIIVNGGADAFTLVAVIVAATANIFGGPSLDPYIEVRDAVTNGFIACNDDNGSSFGGCDPGDTFDITGFDLGLYEIRVFDSFVVFFLPPNGARISVRRSSSAGFEQTCGVYAVQILGL